MAFQIYPATSSHGVRAAMNLYLADEDRLHALSSSGQPPIQRSEAEVQREFRHWLHVYESAPEGFIVAEDDEKGQIVGVAAAVRRPPQWILANFYVDPAYQGRGIGRRLLERAFTVREGCDRFCVHASSEPAAQTLYMKFGMYPQPYSIIFKGQMKHNIGKPKHVNIEKVEVHDDIQDINRIDQQVFGFERAVDHLRWALDSQYYLARTKDARDPFGYFCVADWGQIGPAVTAQPRWRMALLDMALMAAKELADKQSLFIPGANTVVIERLLAYGFRYEDFNMFLSSVPIPGLAQVMFHDTDFL
jgi:GNAT superfamily N-acetyltransferase